MVFKDGMTIKKIVRKITVKVHQIASFHQKISVVYMLYITLSSLPILL
jgi:hypothetical protein